MKKSDESTEQLLKEIEQLKAKVTELEKFETKDKLNEEKVRLSEERYRLLFNLLPYGGEVIDTKGNIINCSSSTAKMLGYKISEMIGQHITKFLSPDSFQIFKQKFPELMNGKSVSTEIRMICKDGSKLDILRAAQPILDHSGKVESILALNLDITERKQIEDYMRQSEEKFRHLFENSPFGITICKMLKNEESEFIDFIHLEANQSTKNNTGFELNQLVGKKASEIIDVKTLRELVRLYGNVLISGKSTSYEQHFEIYNRTLEVTAFPLYDDFFIINFINITDRKQAEAELHESKKQLELALIGADAGLWSWNIKTGEDILDERWCGILGYTIEEIKQDVSSWERLIHPEDRARIMEVTRKHLEDEKNEYKDEYRMKCKNGEWKWIFATGKVIERDEDDNPVLMTGIILDINKQKKVEEELRDSEEKFKTLVTNSEGIVYIIDKDGTFLLSEGKGLSSLGLNPGEVVGKSVYEIYKDYPDMLEEMGRALKGETISSEVIIAGSLYFNNWYSPRLSKDNEVIGLIGLSIDNTKQKQAEEELKKHRDNLEEMVETRTKELKEKNKKLDDAMKVFVGRELTIRDLQNKIKALGGKF